MSEKKRKRDSEANGERPAKRPAVEDSEVKVKILKNRGELGPVVGKFEDPISLKIT